MALDFLDQPPNLQHSFLVAADIFGRAPPHKVSYRGSQGCRLFREYIYHWSYGGVITWP